MSGLGAQWLVAPILIPLLAAVACLLVGRRSRWQHRLSLLGAAALLAVAVGLFRQVRDGTVLVMHLGGWPAPYGIPLVADLLAGIMLLVTGVVAVGAALYALADVDLSDQSHGFHPLYQVLLAGICGAFLTGDLFNLYVWFEVMLVASFVLLVGGGRRAQIQGAVKYVSLNLLSSTLFLCAIALLYGEAGTLNLADLAQRLVLREDASSSAAVTVVALLFLLALGIKAALFPLFFWLPASYHTPAFVVSAVFAGLLTKVGVYALLRLFTLIFVQAPATTHGLLVGAALLTMLAGVLGALAQGEIRRILSFQIIAHVGVMVLALGIYTAATLSAGVFYLIHDILVKTGLFLLAGLIFAVRGSTRLRDLGGLAGDRPGLTALFLIMALSLAGLPPLSGFFAKLLVVSAALEQGYYGSAAAVLLVDLLTLLSMALIWNQAFWQPAPAGPANDAVAVARRYRLGLAAVAPFALSMLGLGLAAGPVAELARHTAAQLLNPGAYVTAILGGL